MTLLEAAKKSIEGVHSAEINTAIEEAERRQAECEHKSSISYDDDCGPCLNSNFCRRCGKDLWEFAK